MICLFYCQRPESNFKYKKLNEESRHPNKKNTLLILDSEHQNPRQIQRDSEIPSISKGICFDNLGKLLAIYF